MTRFKLGLLSLSMAIIAACEPAFIAGEAEQFSRKIGLIDNYDISRWHGLIYSRDSHFALAALVDDAQSASAILNAGQKGFSPYFASAVIVQANSVADAIAQARIKHADFVAVSTLLDMTLYKNEEGITTEEYAKADVLMSIYDVNSRKVVDKVIFHASKQIFSSNTPSLEQLLYKPMQAVAQELTGGR